MANQTQDNRFHLADHICYVPISTSDNFVRLTGTRATGAAGSCEGTRLTDIKWSYDFNWSYEGKEPICPKSFSLNDTSASPIAGLGQWAGTWKAYTKHTRGQLMATQRTIVITPEGKITVDKKEIKGALYSASSNKLVWFKRDGNQSNLAVTFGTALSTDFVTERVEGPVFSGLYQEDTVLPDAFQGQKIGQ
jgi:hypothetical protein